MLVSVLWGVAASVRWLSGCWIHFPNAMKCGVQITHYSWKQFRKGGQVGRYPAGAGARGRESVCKGRGARGQGCMKSLLHKRRPSEMSERNGCRDPCRGRRPKAKGREGGLEGVKREAVAVDHIWGPQRRGEKGSRQCKREVH